MKMSTAWEKRCECAMKGINKKPVKKETITTTNNE